MGSAFLPTPLLPAASPAHGPEGRCWPGARAGIRSRQAVRVWSGGPFPSRLAVP